MIHLSILLEKFFGCEIRPVYVSFELDFTNEYLKAFPEADFGTLGGYFASFSPCLPDTRVAWVAGVNGMETKPSRNRALRFNVRQRAMRYEGGHRMPLCFYRVKRGRKRHPSWGKIIASDVNTYFNHDSATIFWSCLKRESILCWPINIIHHWCYISILLVY